MLPTWFITQILYKVFLPKLFAKVHHVDLTEGVTGSWGAWHTEEHCRTEQEPGCGASLGCIPGNTAWLWLPKNWLFKIALNTFCTVAIIKKVTKHIPHLSLGQFGQKQQKL